MISPYAKRGYIDQQILSFDADLKFIEDDLLGGQRLDPKTDGRPDARPTVREHASVLGDLRNGFDFSQKSRPPLILAPRPSQRGTPMLPRMRVGLLYPGEMGAAIGAALLQSPLWASDGRSRATARRAAALEDVGNVEALVECSEVILSVCPPAIAEDTAARVAGLGFDGLYVDANAISPRRMERIAARFSRCVDGSITAKTRINLYLSGDSADVAEIATLFT